MPVNFGELIVILVLLGVVFLAGRSLWRKRKSPCSCGSDCGSCCGCGQGSSQKVN